MEKELKKIVVNLLDETTYKLTEHIAEELRLEYPKEYDDVMRYYQVEYGLSACGARNSPLQAVNEALNQLLEEGIAAKKVLDNNYLWCRRPNN